MSYCPFCDQLRGPFYPDDRICLCSRDNEPIDICQELKDAGFVYREPNKNHRKYKECEELMKESFLMDREGKLWVDVEEKDD